jgi:hypothetical protein
MVELRALAINGPDAENDKVIRWRWRDEVARRFTVTVTERAIGNWLHTLKLTRSQPRPLHPKKDAAAREAFKESAPITNFVGGKPGRRMIQTRMDRAICVYLWLKFLLAFTPPSTYRNLRSARDK